MIDLFLKGLMIGFCIAAPVGPIGILCINRSLHGGFKSGFLTGCGAATADGFYGLIAGFGLTAISLFLTHQRLIIQLIGGLFLIYLGIKTLLAKPAEKEANTQKSKGLLGDYLNTFFLTITNPMTILSFIAVFAGLGIGGMHISYLKSILLVLGVIFGSLVWWLSLTLFVSKILHHRVNIAWLKFIGLISGSILIGFGLFSLISSIRLL